MSETEAVPMETTTNEANGTTPEVEMKSEATGAEVATPEVEMKQASDDGSVLGIDFGSQTCVASVALKGQGLPVLVPNNLSNLSTPNVVSFRPDERVIGEEAANRMISDAQSTVSLTKLLLGKRFSELDPEFVSKTLPYKLVRGGADNDTVLIKVNYGEEEKDSLFTVPHVSAMMLKELVHYTAKYISNKTPVPPKKVVIAIPSSWGPREKRAIVDAAKIAGLEVLSLISENTAVALAYGFTHDLEENAAPKNVAVVNLGHQFFAVQVVQYTHQKLKVLSSTCDSGLGGGVVDQRLVQHFAKEFQERYKVDAQSNVKARTRLMRACEKAKKVLSTIPETDLELDCLMDDIFVKGKISRNVLEELIQDQLAKMKELIHQALNSAGLKPEDISEVEIVGGGVRIPAVQTAISEAFGGKELSKHIDGSSAVAEGAAIFASILTPGFDFVYNVEDSFMEQQEAEEGLSESELQEAIEREKVMDEKDRIRHETAAAKNHLETQLYDLRDKVGGDKFTAQIGSKKDELLSLLQKTEDWLYGDEEGQGDHPDTNKGHFEAKLQEIKNEIEKISPEFHQHLIQLQEQKDREIAAAAAERERLASQPSVSSRDKTEKPLTKKEKFEAAKKRKNQGNICFKDGDFEGAVTRYVGAVTLADEIIDSVTEEEKKELLEVKISSFLNIAICCLKVHNDTKAIDMCKKVLELDPNNVKALFRRAHALRNTKEYELALADLLKAQKIEPQNSDVSKAIVQVKKLIEDEKARQRKTYAKMFS